MPFQFVETPIDGLIIVKPRVFAYDHSFFMESY